MGRSGTVRGSAMRDDYYTIRTRDLSDLPVRSRPSPLRAALLFSSAVVALAVLVTPELNGRRIDTLANFLPNTNPGIDRMAVGSIDPVASTAPLGLRGARQIEPRPTPTAWGATDASTSTRSYVVRRSVLTEGSVCIIGADGSRKGAC